MAALSLVLPQCLQQVPGSGSKPPLRSIYRAVAPRNRALRPPKMWHRPLPGEREIRRAASAVVGVGPGLRSSVTHRPGCIIAQEPIKRRVINPELTYCSSVRSVPTFTLRSASLVTECVDCPPFTHTHTHWAHGTRLLLTKGRPCRASLCLCELAMKPLLRIGVPVRPPVFVRSPLQPRHSRRTALPLFLGTSRWQLPAGSPACKT